MNDNVHPVFRPLLDKIAKSKSDPIKFDVGGWDSSADEIMHDVRPMRYAVYQDGHVIALCRTSLDAEALMELLEAKYGRKEIA